MAFSGIIPQQQYELIRDRIGVILFSEFANQYNLSGGTTPNPKFYCERIIQFDHTEAPAVNVTLQRGDYTNRDRHQVDGTYMFTIDVYTAAHATSNQRGDYRGAVEMHRILGMIRAIFESPEYRELQFQRPSICHTEIKAISVPEPPNNNESVFEANGRIEFEVRVPETLELQEGLPLMLSNTTVRLYNTDEGYLWGAESQPPPNKFVDEIELKYFIAE
jgi:hypothetical protein